MANASIGFGGNGYYNYGNIHLENSSPTLTDVLLHDSAEYGLYCQGECTVLSGVTYADNTTADPNLE